MGYTGYILIMKDKETTMLLKRVPADIRDEFKKVCIDKNITMRDALIDYMAACGASGMLIVSIVEKAKQEKPSIEDIERMIKSLMKSVEEIKKAGDVEDPTARGEA